TGELVSHGDREDQGLARARRCDGEDVTAGDGVTEREGLHRGGLAADDRRDGVADRDAHAEIGEEPVESGPGRGAQALTSERSPLHSVWKLPSRSVRRYVCAPKKSRCPWMRAAGRRSVRRPSK